MGDKLKLVSFMKSLKNKGILDFDKDVFSHRLKLQKYVFIAREFGLKTNYVYSLYLRGPYSRNLADDYYSIDNLDGAKAIKLDENFIELIKNKDEEWLELASTIIMIKNRYETISIRELVDLVKSAKPYATNRQLREIITELKTSMN